MDGKFTNARNLRKNNTRQEHKLWSILRNRKLNNLKFKRQVPIGPYIVDFVCNEKKLIIELDGGHHNEMPIIEYDNKRTAFLLNEGYNVIRFWNSDIENNIDGVVEKILNLVK